MLGKTIVGILLLCTTPIFAPLIVFTSVTKTTWLDLLQICLKSPSEVLYVVFDTTKITTEACRTLGLFFVVAALLYHLPGTVRHGPVTQRGNTPEYVDNGIAHMCLFYTLFVTGAVAGAYKLSILYFELLGMIHLLNVVAFVFCIYLYVKGVTHPTTNDVTFSGRGLLYDFFAGIELYPRVLGLDVKKFVNCRFSMTFWMTFGLSAVAASYELHGVVDPGLTLNALLTTLYLATFFLWEIGYMRSIDIIEDNTGFMETWGCLVFVPAFYTNHLHFAVTRPPELTREQLVVWTLVGLSGIILSYWTNRQRQVFRETNGKSMLWWPHPPKGQQVEYTVFDGEKSVTKHNLLLTNGFWGVVRHPQYVFEMMVALAWGMLSNPAKHGPQPLLYFFFIVVLLCHRARRDQVRCREKYGAGYAVYQANVPYMIIPGIY